MKFRMHIHLKQLINLIFFLNMLEVFLYYCLANAYPDINTAIPGMSKEKMDAFADWLEGNLE